MKKQGRGFVILYIKMKKGQIRMSETIAVLFIFFVLILFGIIFYYNFQKVSIKEKQEEALAIRAIETTLKTLYLPELICSNGYGNEVEDNCFDLTKMKHAQELIVEKEDYYFSLFGYSKITVYQLYPEGADPLVLYEKVKPDWTSKEPTYFVVALRDGLTGLENYKFAYLEVEVYS